MSAVVLPVVDKADLPECHAEGVEPEGYAASEEECDGCKDKFTCLAKSLELSIGPETSIEADQEVVAVLAGTVTYEDALARMGQRRSLRERGETVPDDMRATAPIEPSGVPTASPPPASEPPPAPPEPEPEPVDASEPEPPQTASETPAKKKKKKLKKKKATKKKAPPKAPAAVAKPKAKRKEKDPDYPLPGGKPLPQPRTIPAEKMLERIKGGAGKRVGVRIDCPVALELGMQIVRRKRDGTEIIVTLQPNGFEYNGETYASLSSCCIVAEKRIVSGNDFFNLSKHQGTEVRDRNGQVIAT